MANNNTNYVEVTPAAPAYVIDKDNHLARVVKYLIDISDCEQTMVVLQSFKGIAIEHTVNFHVDGGTSIPARNDTVWDVFVYDLFCRLDFDKESTINELNYWGIDKVYYHPYNCKVLGIVEFLDRVKENFVDKGKLYYDASDEDKQCIFKK